MAHTTCVLLTLMVAVVGLFDECLCAHINNPGEVTTVGLNSPLHNNHTVDNTDERNVNNGTTVSAERGGVGGGGDDDAVVNTTIDYAADVVEVTKVKETVSGVTDGTTPSDSRDGGGNGSVGNVGKGERLDDGYDGDVVVLVLAKNAQRDVDGNETESTLSDYDGGERGDESKQLVDRAAAAAAADDDDGDDDDDDGNEVEKQTEDDEVVRKIRMTQRRFKVYDNFYDEFYGIERDGKRDESMNIKREGGSVVKDGGSGVDYDYRFYDEFYGLENKGNGKEEGKARVEQGSGGVNKRGGEADGEISALWKKTVDLMIEELSDFLDKNNPCILLKDVSVTNETSASVKIGGGSGSGGSGSGSGGDGLGRRQRLWDDGVNGTGGDLRTETLKEMENKINGVFQFCGTPTTSPDGASGAGDDNSDNKTKDNNTEMNDNSKNNDNNDNNNNSSDKSGGDDEIGDDDNETTTTTTTTTATTTSAAITPKATAAAAVGQQTQHTVDSSRRSPQILSHAAHDSRSSNEHNKPPSSNPSTRPPTEHEDCTSDDDDDDDDDAEHDQQQPRRHQKRHHRHDCRHRHHHSDDCHHHRGEEEDAKKEEDDDYQSCYTRTAPQSSCIDIFSQESLVSQLCTKMTSLDTGSRCMTSKLLANQKKAGDVVSSLEREVAALRSTVELLQRSAVFYAEAPFGSSQVRGYNVKVIQGQGFEPVSGFFTAPYDGAYQITVGYFRRGMSNTYDQINVLLDRQVIFRLHVDKTDEQRMFMTPLTSGQTLSLKTNVDYNNETGGGPDLDLVQFGAVLVK